MVLKVWDSPVVFVDGKGIETITSTSSALRYLIENWAPDCGPLHLVAREVCMDVLEDLADREDARAAFIAAVKELGATLVQ
ncbi:DUF982 domain-containing protein [Rhizobiaceae bacterium n13]|uniref:DUF982 domain-containing protein n=1 Tax=Ferirhizobium litorale TaxID=2927786 RepID=UPI0024B28C3B|nr:DUF982 domain-containing protein [Fererhizobium litorale]MDI7865198.1 DUF982 domain-containing protein [Fererhizobium litorale]